MDRQFRVETVLTDRLAELYQGVMEEFESKSSTPLSELNRTLLQTGLIHHLFMMSGLGLINADRVQQLEALAEEVGKDNLLWEVVELARDHWRNDSGTSGTLDLKA